MKFLFVALLAVATADDRVLAERSAYLMGTRVRMAIWSGTREAGLRQLETALGAIEETERDLSTWRADSDVSALNRAPQGTPWNVPDTLCRTFRVLARWTRETDNAFDPAIGSLIDAWDLHGEGRIPTPDELERARSHSGFDLLGFDSARCTLSRRAVVTIDVGAWGKGEALDRASSVLSTQPWMIDLGGQISVGGTPPDGKGWRVAIAHPLHRDRVFLEIRMREGSLSTSAGSERDVFVQDRKVGHILDPRTGHPAPFTGSVTVWHQSALVADILSTALFVMGPHEGLQWAEARGLSACYLVAHADGRIEPLMTGAFRHGMVF